MLKIGLFLSLILLAISFLSNQGIKKLNVGHFLKKKRLIFIILF